MKPYSFLYLLTILSFPLAALAGTVDKNSTSAETSNADTVHVLELFTSQGCYSCPPADELLGTLSQDPAYIAISCHVTYWDYLGWKDSFSQKFCDSRQSAYNTYLNRRSNYTPQLVIDGQIQAVGSQKSKVERALLRAKQRPALSKISLSKQASSLFVDLTKLLNQDLNKSEIEIAILGIGKTQTVDISQGENGGKQLTYHNPLLQSYVKVLEKDSAAQFVAPLEEYPNIARWAVLAQDIKSGAILGAGQLIIAN